MLTQKGVDLLVDELGYEPEELDWRPSYNRVDWPFLRHQLAINDAYISFKLGAEALGWWIERWTDDRILKRQHVDRVLVPDAGREVAVVPDAYFVLAGNGGQSTLHFFLEIDRATMTVVGASKRVKSWQDKIRAYQEYFDSPEIVERYGTRRIRVLTIAPTETRMANLLRATEAIGGRRRYWFTNNLQADHALRDRIWHVAGEESPMELVSRP